MCQQEITQISVKNFFRYVNFFFGISNYQTYNNRGGKKSRPIYKSNGIIKRHIEVSLPVCILNS